MACWRLGAAALITLSLPGHDAAAVGDSRQEAPLVKLATAAHATVSERRFTGVIAARVQSNLGFRVAGKIIRRLVDVGEEVKAGQPLMKIDESDLRLAVTAKRNAVITARAAALQARNDEKRYATLVQSAAVSVQRHEQAQAALDTAEAQLAAAEAEARVAENEAAYSTLAADADGTVVEALGEGLGETISVADRVTAVRRLAREDAWILAISTLSNRAGEIFLDGTGGERGIRTLDTVSRIHAFQACAFNHSATPPSCAPTR